MCPHMGAEQLGWLGTLVNGCVSPDRTNVKVFDRVPSLTGSIKNGLFRADEDSNGLKKLNDAMIL